MKTKINLILLLLFLLDAALYTVCLFFPEFWIQTMNGAAYIDTLGLVRRLGAGWAAFFLFQFIALFKWQEEPYWLVLVTGIRWTELFADWVYLYFAESITPFGKICFLLSPPVNLFAGWYLLSCYKKIMRPT